MALRKIVVEGDDILTKPCRDVTSFDGRLHVLLDDMKETLIDAEGVGLAGPQVGILRRICIVQDDQGEYIELINPEIIETEGEQTGMEGCLSVPDKFGIVTRPMRVRVKAQDRDGVAFETEGEGLTARAFCHEIDHLHGHMYTELIDRFLTDKEVEALCRQEDAEEEE